MTTRKKTFSKSASAGNIVIARCVSAKAGMRRLRSREISMHKMLIAAALFSTVAVAPASAAMMSCTADNMAKTSTMMTGMADGSAKMAMGKEMGMANAEMSKGNMRGGCMHCMKAQKMGMMKQ